MLNKNGVNVFLQINTYICEKIIVFRNKTSLWKN